jgi:signal transduction histidine kinase
LLNEKGFVNQLEVGIRDKYRQLSTCQLSSRSFVSNNEIFVIFSPINISRLREVESEIRTLNTQLEQKVSERTLSLEQANEELQHALKTMKSMQDEMFRSEKMAALGYLVAGISHELNTPIGNSLMVASTLRDHAEALSLELNNPQPRKTRLQNLIADSEKGAHILVRNLQRAAHLILSFKQVAVDQSSDHRRVFDLKKTVEEVLLTLEPIYRRTSHQLICELAEGIGMESYPGALAQVITNAVTNAISHGFDGRENGTMRLTASMRNNSEVEIRFSDDGIGIPPQNIARVFDPFFTTKLGQGGSGLGLNIVYNLATEVLGGTIKLDSAINAGTSIILILPIFAPLKNNE